MTVRRPPSQATEKKLEEFVSQGDTCFTKTFNISVVDVERPFMRIFTGDFTNLFFIFTF